MKNFNQTTVRGRRRKDTYIFNKVNGKCELCNNQWPSDVLCFHHLDPNTKLMELNAKTWGSRKLKILLDEAEKCVILCMNCHTLEHKALTRGESLLNDKEAYSRYRNHRIKREEGGAHLDGWDYGLPNRTDETLSRPPQ
jgi:hypothetical protein